MHVKHEFYTIRLETDLKVLWMLAALYNRKWASKGYVKIEADIVNKNVKQFITAAEIICEQLKSLRQPTHYITIRENK